MSNNLRRLILLSALLAVVTLGALVIPGGLAQAVSSCPVSPSTDMVFHAGVMVQYDTDNPVRLTSTNADKNLSYRGWNNPVGASSGLNPGYATSDTTPPPQLATIFNPARVPTFLTNYQVNSWNWTPSPNPGSPGPAITSPAVTAVSMQTTPGEPLRSPCHGYNLGSPWGVGGMAVLYADATSITLTATRYDSVARGYAIHILNINTDPNLLSLYNSLDCCNRYVYHGNSFNLPGLKPGQIIGTAAGSSIIVAYRDTGAFMDPLDQHNWWQVTSWPATPYSPPGPTLISPANGFLTNNVTPSFSWGSAASATAYLIQIDDASDFATPLQDYTTPDASTFNYTASALGQGVFYWRVGAVYGSPPSPGWSAIRSFTIDTTPPAVPRLLAPWTTKPVTRVALVLKVKSVPSAVQYHYEVSASPGCAPTVFAATTNKTSVTVSPPLPGFGIYYWCASASDAAGNQSAWSNPIAFKYTTARSPVNDSATTDTTPTFAWGGVSGATSYTLEYANNPGFSGVVDVPLPGGATSYTPATPLPVNAYYWRLQMNGNGLWSPIMDFFITHAKAPKNNSVTTDTTPTFKWTRLVGVTGWTLLVSSTPDFSSGNVPIPPLPGTATSYTLITPLADGTYYWQLQPNGGALMPEMTFTISHMRRPTNGSFTTDNTPTFSWASAPGATSYTLEYANDPGFSSPVDVSLSGGTTSYTVPNPAALPSNTYYWHLRFNGGPWMPTWSFTIP